MTDGEISVLVACIDDKGVVKTSSGKVMTMGQALQQAARYVQEDIDGYGRNIRTVSIVLARSVSP